MKTHLQEAIHIGGTAARQNLVPGIILQILALTLIVSYYQIDTFKDKLDTLGSLNTRYFPWFAIVVTMIFGGIIPLAIEAIQNHQRSKKQRPALQICFTLFIWGINGALTAWLYNAQDTLFGSELNFWTVFKKVCVDQFIWVPLYVVPVFTLCFLWRDKHFSLSKTKESLKSKSFLSRGLPLMISNWAVWIPAVSIIYAFPVALQMILMNLILVFWSLILTIFVAD